MQLILSFMVMTVCMLLIRGTSTSYAAINDYNAMIRTHLIQIHLHSLIVFGAKNVTQFLNKIYRDNVNSDVFYSINKK